MPRSHLLLFSLIAQIFLAYSFVFGSIGRDSKLSLVEEVRGQFTLDQKPIHPMLIERFMPHLVGQGPVDLAFDLEAAMAQTRRVDEPRMVEVFGTPHVYYRYSNDFDRGLSGYAYIGRLADEGVVLKTIANYGGTMSVIGILVVDVSIWDDLDQGSPRLVMSLRHIVDLPSSNAKVFIKDNTLTVKHFTQDSKATETVHEIPFRRIADRMRQQDTPPEDD